MMKITSPEGLQQTQPENVKPKNAPLGSNDFGKVLKEALEKPGLNSGVQQSDRLPEPHPVQSFGNSNSESTYIDKTSKVINLMDSYARFLSNPRKTLKEIEPELMTFVDEARDLHKEYVNSGNVDSGLKNILEDLLRAARLESARFNRGDYLDSE